MADFAEWIVAAEPALPWEAGAFLTAYSGNQARRQRVGAGSVPRGPGAARLHGDAHEADGNGPVVGHGDDLLGELETITDEKTKRQKSWPGSARTLSNTLRRLAPNLRAVGVDLVFDERKHGGTRIITITDRPE